MSVIYIDAASLEGLMAALEKRHCPSLNAWEKKSLVDLTTVLLLHGDVRTPSSPSRGKQNCHPPEIELIKNILHNTLSEIPPASRTKSLALSSAQRWVSTHTSEVLSQYRSVLKTPSAADLLHFEMSHTLSYDARRLGGLIDSVTLKQVADLFDWPKSEYRSVLHYVNDNRLLDLWQSAYSQGNRLSRVPSILLDSFLLSCVVRGRYYRELAALNGAAGMWHPMRYFPSDMGGAANVVSPFSLAPLALQYVVGMICTGAMLESNLFEACGCWAWNVRRARSVSLACLYEDDTKAAERIAVQFAVDAGLVFRAVRFGRFLRLVSDFLITPLLSVASNIASPVPGLSDSTYVTAILEGPIKSFLTGASEKAISRLSLAEGDYRHLMLEGATAFLHN